ncbi:Coatomer subunit zeta [Kluyveromyces marxianus]|nr:Golgi-to-ER vesicle coat component [Kluyveromyces marxianus]KAG0678575.1 Golgi-to-ER vesicle coat component [Kluyveromyces marxianus]
MVNLSLFTVKAIIILDGEGKRLYSKYFHAPHEPTSPDSLAGSSKKQKEFESNLFNKTHGQNADIMVLNDHLVLYREYVDVSLYLIGGIDENELVLQEAFNGLKDALELILDTGIDKRNIQEHYDMVVLAVDEFIDDGIILETDPATIASRVTKPPSKDIPLNIELSEKGLLSAWGFAKSKLAERLQQGL